MKQQQQQKDFRILCKIKIFKPLLVLLFFSLTVCPECTKIYFKEHQGSKETLRYLHLNTRCEKMIAKM